MEVFQTVDFSRHGEGGELPAIDYIPEATYSVVGRTEKWVTGNQTFRDRIKKVAPFVALYLVTVLACHIWTVKGFSPEWVGTAVALVATGLIGWQIGRTW